MAPPPSGAPTRLLGLPPLAAPRRRLLRRGERRGAAWGAGSRRGGWLAAVLLLLAAPLAAAAGHRHFDRAVAAAAAGRYADALDHFERALAADPDNLRYGAEYRQAAIAAAAYDRAIGFLERLVADHPRAANAALNLGFAYVDKIPTQGAVTQVILANTALGHFTAALEIEESWLGRFSRGNSYLYWPAIFGRAADGIADLERAIELGEQGPKKPYHARAWAALGDGYWRLGDLDKARQVWRQGLARFPDDRRLRERLGLDDAGLDAYLEAHFDTNVRVATDLRELWEE